MFGGAGKLVDESGHCLVGSLVFSAINNIFVKYEEHDEEAAKSFAADRVSSFIIGLLIILTPSLSFCRLEVFSIVQPNYMEPISFL